MAVAAALSLAPGLLLAGPVAIPSAAAPIAAAGLTAGFVDETLVLGLNNPTAVAFAPDGRVFVIEKRGLLKTWPSLAAFERNDPPSVALDIRTDVMNYWDRGLLGLALDPGYPAQPYVYLLYTYDALPGGSAPTWNQGDVDSDPCPSPPGSTTDGCVVTTRLDRVTVDPASGAATARNQLLVGWCQQFPSHSAGSLAFGPDGMLYVSGGEGASFNLGAQDYGQYGGTQPTAATAITPANPCGDPPAAVGGAMTPPTAEGGALRAQSFRRPAGEPAVLNGAILRLDPATGLAAADNPAIANADPIRRRIVAYGLRNPFRITFRPGTSDLYIGDVGYSTWEEVDRLPDPLAGPLNFGWPCHEGPQTGTYYTSFTPNLCSSLTTGVTEPLYDYQQPGHMASGDGCPPQPPATRASASVSGLAFYTGSDYPASFSGALFVADYARNCLVVLPPGAGGVPTAGAIPFSSTAKGPVMLTTDPNGDIVYVAFSSGEIHRFRYGPPIASFTATPSSGTAPLHVTFDGSASSAPAGIASADWDFGDGSAHGAGLTATHTYLTGTFTARLTVTDVNGVTSTTGRTIASSNTKPVVTLDGPTCTAGCWAVGDHIAFSAHATDAEDGVLPASAFSWHVGLEHCHSPTDCHEHDLLDPVAVESGTVVAPDHDAGSVLRFTVTVTDSGGLTDTATIDVAPRQSTLEAVSSPAGLPVTIDGQTGAGHIGPIDAIVGHVATVSAPAVTVSGEDRWTFGSWSDGGAASHQVTVGATPTTLTATFGHSSVDASNTCAGASSTTTTGRWTTGLFGTGTDVDWFRFTVPKTGLYRFLLGDLPVDGSLALYSGCSTLLATSAHPGLRYEEIVRTLAPGSYALRMANASGAASSSSYRWMAWALPAGAALLSAQTAPAPAGSLRFVGQVMNTASTTRALIVTAKLYSATGQLLRTVSARGLPAAIGPHDRSLFVIATSQPAGYARVRFSVSSVAASSATRLLATTGITTTAAGTGAWTIGGTIVNRSTSPAIGVRALVGIFGRHGEVLNATSRVPLATTLAAGKSTTFSATFGGLSAAPVASSSRATAS